MENNEAKMGLGSIKSLFKMTWQMYKERNGVLIEILLLPALVAMLGGVLVYLGGLFGLLGSMILAIGYIFFIFSILPVVFSIHHKTDVDASYKATIPMFWSLVWVFILEVFIVIGGFFMFIIPGIWLSIALSFCVFVFIVENRRGLDVLRQSKEYVKGYWWAVFGRAIVLSIVVSIPSGIIQGIIGAIAGRNTGTIASLIMMVILTPFSMIYSYNIFENLRSLKPELSGVKTKEGTGFLKVSGIVGLIAPILLGIAVIALLAIGISRFRNYPMIPAQSSIPSTY
jgi:hypothetical protein